LGVTAIEERSLVASTPTHTRTELGAKTNFFRKIIDCVRAKIAASDAVLSEARERRDLVKSAAMRLDGALRTFNSGSVAHGFVNGPVSDVDCGVVLDRRTYPTLGPDGNNGGPEEIIDELCSIVRDHIRGQYPSARVAKMKRGIKVTFNAPLEDQDPTVDLIVTLPRNNADGLWVPNRDDDSWDASHPEKHTALFSTGSKKLIALRARVVRLAKAWNKQWAEPALSSFNIAALAWEFVTDEECSVEEALAGFFAYARDEIEKGDTKDPAGVSEPIALRGTRETAVMRLSGAADQTRRALDDPENEKTVRDALSSVFRDYVDPPAESKSALAAILRSGNSGVRATATGLTLTGAGAHLKTTPAFGEVADV
jgi:hypothetical protein